MCVDKTSSIGFSASLDSPCSVFLGGIHRLGGAEGDVYAPAHQIGHGECLKKHWPIPRRLSFIAATFRHELCSKHWTQRTANSGNRIADTSNQSCAMLRNVQIIRTEAEALDRRETHHKAQ